MDLLLINQKLKSGLLSLLLMLISYLILAQTKGELKTTKLVDLDIMHVTPLPPKQVALIFRAQHAENQEPVWDLNKEDLQITEDTQSCKITSLEKISSNSPIHITLVIAHSGSMSRGKLSFKELYNYFKDGDDYVTPLDHAKKSAKEFVSSFNMDKDQIGIVSFGSVVDTDLKTGNDTSVVFSTIDSIKIEGSTAYFDALNAGMDQLKKLPGINIVVALTDGAENNSKTTSKEVIAKSRKYNIPIYAIGLGNVQKDTLLLLTDSTNGDFYHTDDPDQLQEIYAKISKQIQSYYAVNYESPALQTKKDSIAVNFTSESPFLLNIPNDPEVLKYLERRAFEKNLFTYGKRIAYALAAGGFIALIVVRRRRKKRRKLALSQSK